MIWPIFPPKTGRAVSREKGLPYRDKLLKLPRFLWQDTVASIDDLVDGFALTSHFLAAHLGNLPATRARILTDLTRRKNG